MMKKLSVFGFHQNVTLTKLVKWLTEISEEKMERYTRVAKIGVGESTTLYVRGALTGDQKDARFMHPLEPFGSHIVITGSTSTAIGNLPLGMAVNARMFISMLETTFSSFSVMYPFLWAAEVKQLYFGPFLWEQAGSSFETQNKTNPLYMHAKRASLLTEKDVTELCEDDPFLKKMEVQVEFFDFEAMVAKLPDIEWSLNGKHGRWKSMPEEKCIVGMKISNQTVKFEKPCSWRWICEPSVKDPFMLQVRKYIIDAYKKVLFDESLSLDI
jgi:hypothetical protein